MYTLNISCICRTYQIEALGILNRFLFQQTVKSLIKSRASSPQAMFSLQSPFEFYDSIFLSKLNFASLQSDSQVMLGFV